MTTMRKTLFTGLAALSLGTAAIGAYAQSAPAQTQQQAGNQQGRPMHQRMTPEQRAAFRAQRVAKLHDALKITPAQEAAWKTFVAAMEPPARGQRPHRDRAARAQLSAPDRMAEAIDRQKLRTAAMEQRLGALTDFYTVLTPEQRKAFDDRTNRMQNRFRHGRPGMGQQQQQGGNTANG